MSTKDTDFSELFAGLGTDEAYLAEFAILELTEEIGRRMSQLGLSRSELAKRLGTTPAYVTKILRGDANFTLRTIVRLAIALDSEFRCHLQPEGASAHWYDLVPGRQQTREKPMDLDQLMRKFVKSVPPKRRQTMIPSPLQLKDYFFSRVHVDACQSGCEDAVAWEAQTEVRQNKDESRSWLVRLILKQEATEEHCPLYTFELDVIGIFEVVERYPAEKRESLVRANGPAVLFGAAREMLAFLTNRGPHPGVVLPTVTFVDELAEPAEKPASRKARVEPAQKRKRVAK